MISAISERNCVRRSCYLHNSGDGEINDTMRSALLAAAETADAEEAANQRNNISLTTPTSSDRIDGSSAVAADENEELTLLIEIVAATIPKLGKRRHEASASASLTPQARGMHVTTHWIGPVNPSGRKRRDITLHRTKTLKLSSGDSSDWDAPPGIDTHGKFNHLEDKIFTVEDASLFLFKTTMRQLVNAAAHDDRMSNGGLRFDIFEKPVNILTTSVSNLSDTIRLEKEACAINRESSASSLLGGSYKLIGTLFLSPEDILSSCDGSRIEFKMVDKLALSRHNGHKNSAIGKNVPGARLALRMRKATGADIAFMRLLQRKLKFGCDDIALMKDLSPPGKDDTDDEGILPVQLLTEIDETLIAAQTSLDCINNVAHATHEQIRYLISDDTEKKYHVKPYPDPTRKKETAMLTKTQLREECYKPSTKWIHAGSGSLGTVYLEILECRGLPNTDTGESLGNITDAFISAVYGDVLVQTDVIDDSLSPMWMPWSTRAFKLQMSHPSTAIFIGVTDYDVGPMDHETIGRVSIQLGKFCPGIMYTLTYDLHDSSNLIEKGESVGKITVRIRVEYDEQKMLMKALEPPVQSWVTSKQKKTHKVAKYCTEGPHDDDVFELQLLWSQIDEIWGKKRLLSYMISDMFYSLIFWRDQVQGLPLHSAVLFYLSVNVVERPHLLPSYILFLSGWVMVASLMQRNNHPNPWKRGKPFMYYWNILVHGECVDIVPSVIQPMDGFYESEKYEKRWTQRLKEDNERYARQAALDERLQQVCEESNIRTRSKSKLKGALVDKILAPKLLYYQQWLSTICVKIRLVRNVYNWSEAEIAFFITLALFGSSFVALFIPWVFLMRWTSRFVVWVCMGPQMRLVDSFLHGSDEERRRKNDRKKSSRQIAESFQQQHKLARIQRESALKIKSFRKLLFGRYNTKVPERGFLSRHEDIPLPESFAEVVSDEYIPNNTNTSSAYYIPGQNLTGGELIPRIGHDINQYLKEIQEEKEGLMTQFNSFTDRRKSSGLLTKDTNSEDDEIMPRFELVRSDTEVICLQAPDLIESSVERSLCTTPLPLPEMNPAENVIQKAVQVDLQTKMFSASLSVSIKTQSPGNASYAHSDISSVTHTIDDTAHWPHAIEDDLPQEEGVEIVPVMSATEGQDEVESIESRNDTSTVFHQATQDTDK